MESGCRGDVEVPSPCLSTVLDLVLSCAAIIVVSVSRNTVVSNIVQGLSLDEFHTRTSF